MEKVIDNIENIQWGAIESTSHLSNLPTVFENTEFIIEDNDLIKPITQLKNNG